MATVSLSGLDKAAVLAALYNGSQPQGMGFAQYDPNPMTIDQAKALLAKSIDAYFDYVKGRVMKVDLSGDELDPRLYDRDNGDGSAQRIIETLRESGDVNHETVQRDHNEKAQVQAMDTRTLLGEKSKRVPGGFQLGLGDLADQLKPKIDKVLRGR